MQFELIDGKWVDIDGSGLVLDIQKSDPNIPPPTITAVYAGGPGHGYTRVCRVDRMEFLRRVEFGPPRQYGNSEWSGDFFSFFVFLYSEYSHLSPSLIVIQSDGSGRHTYLFDKRDFATTMSILCRAMPSPQLWDIFRTLIETYHTGMQYGSQQSTERYLKAFKEGRLKKRKMPRINDFKVWIEKSDDGLNK